MATASRVINEAQAQKSGAKSDYKIKEMQYATGYGALRAISTKNVASTLFLDPRYQSGEISKALWAPPVTIYMPAGRAFGSTVEFSNVVFNVPAELQGLKDAAIALPSKSFKTMDVKDKIVISIRKGKQIKVVENFPSTDGWYLIDPKTGIPQGAKVSSDNPEARYLWRRDDEPYIGPVVRDYDYFNNDRRNVNVYQRLDDGFGVVLVERVEPERKLRVAQVATETKLSRKVGALLRDDVGPAEENLQRLTGVVSEDLLKAQRKLIRKLKEIEIKA